MIGFLSISKSYQQIQATIKKEIPLLQTCLLYTSDAADDLLCVDLGGRRIIKKKKNIEMKRGKTAH